MKRMTIVCTCLLCGCAVTKPTQPSVCDSVHVEIIERVERVTDTVYINIPHEKISQTVRDTTSQLEVEYARSTATITSDGLLHHSLEQKPITRPVETVVEVVVKDSIVYRDREIIKLLPKHNSSKEQRKTWCEKILTLSAILLIFVFILKTRII